MTIELQVTPEGVLLNAPHVPRIKTFAQSLDAIPQGDGWLFSPEHEEPVREFCRRVSRSLAPGASASPPVQPVA